MAIRWTHIASAAAAVRARPGHAALILAFPPAELAFFAFLRINDVLGANFFVASCAALSVTGAAFFAWGAGLAADRAGAAGNGDRAAPGAPDRGPIALAAGAGLLAAISVALVLAVAAVLTPAAIAPAAAAVFAAAVVAGGATLGLVAAAGALWLPARWVGLFLSGGYWILAVGGGLVFPPWRLPTVVWQASVVLPSRHIAEAVWAPGLGWAPPLANWLAMAGFALAFGALAAAGWRRTRRRSAPRAAA